MANEKVSMDISANLSVKNANKATNDIKKTANALDLIQKKLDGIYASIAKINKQGSGFEVGKIPTRTANSLIRNYEQSRLQSSVRTTKNGTFTLNVAPGDKTAQQEYQKYFKLFADNLKTQTELQQKDNNIMQKKILNSTKYNDNMERFSKVKEKESSTRMAYINSLRKRMDDRLRHPEKYEAISQRKNYIAGSQVKRLGSNLAQYGVPGKVAGSAFEVIGSSLINPVMGFMTAIKKAGEAVIAFTTASVKASAEIESLKTNLGVVYGDQTQANSAFREISQYAVKSPFGIEQTTEMAILLKQSGVYATDLMDTLKMIGDTAGGNADKMKRIANNYAQITSIGKASMLDMRQFAYAGIPIFKAVSKELGVSQEQLRKMISDGKVTSDIIEKVFKDLTGANGLFEDATAKGAKTLKARLQNLKDSKQLFLASTGDAILHQGLRNDYGDTSLIVEAINKLEKIFDEGHQAQYLANIQKDVEAIKEHNNEIDNIEKLIEYAEKSGDKLAVKALNDKLTRLVEMKDYDKERTVLSSLYEEKAKNIENIKKTYGTIVVEELQKQYKELQDELNKRVRQYGTQDYNSLDRDVLPELRVEVENLKQAVEDATAFYNISDAEKRAHSETSLMQEQQRLITSVEKSAGKTSSVISDLSSIQHELSELPEEQERNRKAQLDKWQESINLLSSIDNHIDESGNVDFSKLSMEKFFEVMNKGGFSSTDLIVTYGERYQKLSPELQKSNMAALSENLKTVSDRIFSEVGLTGSSEQKFVNIFLKDITSLEDSKAKFNAVTEVNDRLKTIIEKASEENQQILKDYLAAAFSTYSSVDNAGQYDLSLLKSKSSYPDQQPLWKRIISSYLGIPLNSFTGSQGGVDVFTDYYSKKNLATNVFGAIGDIETQRKLLKYKGYGTKDGDQVYQIDWNKTNEAIKKFTFEIDGSSKVIEAYKNSLESERDTLLKLATSGLYTEETVGVEKIGLNKDINATLLSNLGNLNSQTVVNAFGEQLMTASGKIVELANKKAIIEKDEDGNEKVSYEGKDGTVYSADELYVTGSIYQALIDALKENTDALRGIDRDLAKANTKEAIIRDILPSYMKYQSGAAESGGDTDYLNTVEKYSPNYVNAILESTLQQGLDDFKEAGYDPEKLSKSSPMYNPLVKSSKGKGSTIVYSKEAINYFSDPLLKPLKIIADALSGNYIADSFLTHAYLNEYNASHDDEHELGILYDLYKKKDYLDAINDLRDEPDNYRDRTRKSLLKQKEDGSYSGMDWGTRFWKDELPWNSHPLRESVLKSLGYDEETAELLKNSPEIWGKKGEKKSFKESKDKQTIWAKSMQKIVEDTGDSLLSITAELGKGLWLKPFEMMGEYMVTYKDNADDLLKELGNLGATVARQIGPLLAQCGLQIAAAAAATGNWGMIAVGLGLAAAGGITTGVVNGLAKKEEDKRDNDKNYQRTQDLKDQLAALIEQARNDSLYYERNLRHKTALGINKDFSIKSVNDAIISPSGDVITTHPDDYLIATKTPNALLNGPVSQPQITFKVINNSSNVQVRQEKRQNEDGTMELIALIEDVCGNFIASNRGDDAFNARSSRERGISSVM